MTDDQAEKMPFHAMTGGYGTSFGGLQDPTAVSVGLSGFTYGQEAGWEWFSASVERHKEALDGYQRVLRSTGGDVTDPRVKRAATELHVTIAAIPIGHAAYAGVGFPSPNREAPTTSEIEDTRSEPRGDAARLHPHVDTALSGSRSQRIDLAQQPELPLEVELILARDPEADVRRALVFDGTRSRMTMLLMERDEADSEIRGLFTNQRFASPELKMGVPLADLYPQSLEGVADLLGLDGELRARLMNARDNADPGDEMTPRVTLQHCLAGVGWRSQ